MQEEARVLRCVRQRDRAVKLLAFRVKAGRGRSAVARRELGLNALRTLVPRADGAAANRPARGRRVMERAR